MNGQREIIEIPARVDRAEERPEKLRVAAYCRVSTSQEAQQNSYQAQRAYYLDIIESNPNWILADIFADEGISGTSVYRRAEFQRMIRWCKRGKIDLILTKSISRFARNIEDCLHYVRMLKTHCGYQSFSKRSGWILRRWTANFSWPCWGQILRLRAKPPAAGSNGVFVLHFVRVKCGTNTSVGWVIEKVRMESRKSYRKRLGLYGRSMTPICQVKAFRTSSACWKMRAL